MEKLKLLIAEDTPTTLKLYDKGIGSDLFDIKKATDGQQAVDIYDSWSPDVIILDIMMPLLSGIMVLKYIREENGDQDTIICMSSSMQEKEDIKACMAYGIHGYIVKPFKFKMVEAELFKAIARKDSGLADALRQARENAD